MKVCIRTVVFEDVCLPGTKRYDISPGLNTIRIPKAMSAQVTSLLGSAISFEDIPHEYIKPLSPDSGIVSGSITLVLNVDGTTIEMKITLDFQTGASSTSTSCEDGHVLEGFAERMQSRRLSDSCFVDASDQFGLTSPFDSDHIYADLIFGSDLIENIPELLTDANRMLIGRNGKYPAKSLERLTMTMNKHRLSERELKEYRDDLLESLHNIRTLSLTTRTEAGGIARMLVLEHDSTKDGDEVSEPLTNAMLTILHDPILLSDTLGESMRSFYECLNPLGFPTISTQSMLTEIEGSGRCICGRPIDEDSAKNISAFLDERSVPYPYSLIRTIDFKDCSNLESIAGDMESVRSYLGRMGIPHKSGIAWLRNLDYLRNSVESITDFDFQERLIGKDLLSIVKPDGSGNPSGNLSACHEAINRTHHEIVAAHESLLINERRMRLESLMDSIWKDTMSRLDAEAVYRVNMLMDDELMFMEYDRAAIHPGCDRWMALLVKVLYLRTIGEMAGTELPVIVVNTGSKIPRGFDSLLSDFDVPLIVIGGW